MHIAVNAHLYTVAKHVNGDHAIPIPASIMAFVQFPTSQLIRTNFSSAPARLGSAGHSVSRRFAVADKLTIRICTVNKVQLFESKLEKRVLLT